MQVGTVLFKYTSNHTPSMAHPTAYALLSERPGSGDYGRDFVYSSLSVISARLKREPLYKQHGPLGPYPSPSPTTRHILPSHPELQKRREQKRQQLIEEYKLDNAELKAYRHREPTPRGPAASQQTDVTSH